MIKDDDNESDADSDFSVDERDVQAEGHEGDQQAIMGLTGGNLEYVP